MEVKQIREILEAPYNRKVWKSFIKTSLPIITYWQTTAH
jgi:hypothetical protein